MKLVIGNKNYSSWSMRPWVLMRQLGLPFEEQLVMFDRPGESAFKLAVGRLNPAGKVPLLVEDGGLVVWDSLAIAERLHELFPQSGVWPADAAQRARARSLACEMHSGFGAVRTHFPMNIELLLPEVGPRVLAEQAGARGDLARLDAMWSEALAASGGPMLFGRFCAADAFFAPVCARVRSYALPLSPAAQTYVERVLALPSVQAWCEAALAERRFVPEDEPYRAPPP